MKHYLRIGEVSKLYNIKIHTLRYYDKIGLFSPKYTDPNNEYRYYHIDQMQTLVQIILLRSLDVPIEKIATLFSHTDPLKILEVFNETQIMIEKKKALLDKQLEYILKSKATLNKALSAIDQYEIIQSPAFSIYYFNTPQYDDQDDFDLYMEAKEDITQNLSTDLSLASIFSKTDFTNGNLSIPKCTAVISKYTESLSSYEKIDSMKCVHCFVNENSDYKAIIEYINNAGLEVVDDIIMIDILWSNSSQVALIKELYIPVS